MSSGKEMFSVVFWKTGVSWLKWQRAADCSTRTQLQLQMPGRRWCAVWFVVQWASDGRQITVAGVLPTPQSSASHWRGTEVPRYVGNGKLVRPVEIRCAQGPAASAWSWSKGVMHGRNGRTMMMMMMMMMLMMMVMITLTASSISLTQRAASFSL